ncbi:hypothetical protein [Streptomyces sp. NPDC018031]|uniref:hypothetical protein n=1 Tax=Streptomyces sp. NPDC018031 TaxID=3365033 RepID=UPI003787B84F
MDRSTARHRLPTVLLCAVTAGAALTGCGSGGSDDHGRRPPTRSASTSATASPSTATTPPGPAPTSTPPVGTLPTAYDFTPDPARVPRTTAQARRLASDAVLTPDTWSQGMVRHTPYEVSGSWPVLGTSCVWSRGTLPPHVLATVTRWIDKPARDGKGRVRGSVTVTVHRTERDADREIDDSVQQGFRCPDQELGGGQRVRDLMSMRFQEKDLRNAHASLFEAGTFTGPGSGGPQGYAWSKARIGPVTAAIAVKGAHGYDRTEVLRLAAEGAARVLYRIERELQ